MWRLAALVVAMQDSMFVWRLAASERCGNAGRHECVAPSGKRCSRCRIGMDVFIEFGV